MPSSVSETQRQSEHGALHKLDLRIEPARLRKHPGGEIQPKHINASVPKVTRDLPGTTSKIADSTATHPLCEPIKQFPVEWLVG